MLLFDLPVPSISSGSTAILTLTERKPFHSDMVIVALSDVGAAMAVKVRDGWR